MPDILTVLYLIYFFIAMYFLFFFILIYIPHRNQIFSYPKLTEQYSLSIVVPCYNEEQSIGQTIQALLNLDYKGLKKIIVVDDRSTDNSYNIIKKFAKKYSRVMAVQTPKNTGKASGAKNYGAKFVKTELIGFTDADSLPEPESVGRMIGFFDDTKVGAVTSLVLVKKRNKFLEKVQAIEYEIIAFTRKLLGFVGAIYVTPGPLAIYRKEAFDKVRGFDESNLTEDIEITWHIVHSGYTVEMSVSSKVYTFAPDNFKAWFRQRTRWNIGGIQTINKYKKDFLKRGILGAFILPFFVLSWILGLIGIAILLYRFVRMLIIRYLSTVYSVQAQTAILTLRDINLTPSVLIFFGIVFFVFSLTFTLIALLYLRMKEFKRHRVFSVFVYMFFYVSTYPLVLVTSVYKFLRGRRTW